MVHSKSLSAAKLGWNTRPVEDALRARLEAAETLIGSLDKFALVLVKSEPLYDCMEYEKVADSVAKAREEWEAVNGKPE